MTARTVLTKILGCLLVLGICLPAPAQDSNDANDLAEQLAALQIMNNTVGPMLTQANNRNRQMLEYIGTKDLRSDWSAWRKTADTPGSLTFEEGYKIALQRVKTEQPVSDAGASAEALTTEINATIKMVKSEWKSYNTANATSRQMSAFLESKNALTDYEAWSKTASAKRAAAMQDMARTTNEKEAAAAQKISDKFQAQQRYLMQHWDEEMHLKSLANSSGYVMARNRGSIVADSHDYPYLDSQVGSQSVNSVPQGGSYWGGSWNGGYADPYYDLWGFPKGHDNGDTAYKRTVPPVYHAGVWAKQAAAQPANLAK